MAPPLFIYKDFDAEALQNIINRQKKMKAMQKANNGVLPFDLNAFLVLDGFSRSSCAGCEFSDIHQQIVCMTRRISRGHLCESCS